MDLLASYASSDEEENDQPQPQQRHQTPASPPRKPSLFSSLPQPKSSPSLFSSPQPKQEPASKPQVKLQNNNIIANFKEEDKRPTFKSTTSLFSSLPQPKTETLQQPTSNLTPLDSNPKRVVQFKPPINRPSILDEEDEEDEEEEKERKRKKNESLLQSDSSSVKGFLSSIPAPRNSSTLGVGSLGSGSGRRSVIETEGPTSSYGGVGAENESGVDQSSEGHVSYDGGYVGFDHNGGDYMNYESGADQIVGQNVVGVGGDGVSYGGYESYGGYRGYGDSGQYGNNWGDGSVVAVAETGVEGTAESAVRVMGKRRRNEIPTEIVEVKQDELIKNRPREDQVKLTGIAFGPAYQPASSKGKPSKLHKRKHQIGTLYFDMKQKETELAERRAKGFLTKAETHAKYGW